MRLFPWMFAACIAVLPAAAQKPVKSLTVPIKTSTGQDAGTVHFQQRHEKMEITLHLMNLPPGVHGIHVHQNPVCEAPDFKSAGAHWDPVAHQHENVTVGPDGTAKYRYAVTYLSIGTGKPDDILAGSGRSYMIHEKADDMVSDPTGNAGSRIACGVIQNPNASPAPAANAAPAPTP